MAAIARLVVGDTVYLADEAQLVGFADVVALKPKTATAELFAMRRVEPAATAPGIPGEEDYVPGLPMNLEVTLMADKSVRSGAEVKQALLMFHKLTWGKWDRKPIPRVLSSLPQERR